MRRIREKLVVGILISILTLMTPLFARVNFAQPTRLYVDPPDLTVEVGTQFSVDIKVSYVSNLYSYEFYLGYDTNRLDAISIVVGSFLNPPTQVLVSVINDAAGYIDFGVQSSAPTPASGNGTLATITFNCTGSGTSPLHLYSTRLLDFLGENILHATTDGRVVQKPPWFVKAAFPDYAPSGMPDFDQKQDSWFHPTASWTWCGPVSVANSLWWFDSKYESIYNPSPTPPPVYSDNYPLVQPYGAWDDHDPRNVQPLVNNLAFLMDTDGKRTGLNHSGTFFKDMEVGISQYLGQQGVNPKGDCNGDGVVDFADIEIWLKANGSIPGDPNWNMAADIIPDGRINSFDLSVINSVENYGKVRTFYENTVEFPSFSWISEQIYASHDVVLALEFWQDMGDGNWTRYTYAPGGQGGHYVTLAGANETNGQLLLSDPWSDQFEAGAVPGESPVPHPYPHNATVHDDAQFVSHDAYVAAPWTAPSPYQASLWELTGYLQDLGWAPTWHAFVRAAVTVAPITITTLNTSNSKEPCDPMPTLGLGHVVNITASIVNFGQTEQALTITAYVNGTAVATATIPSLSPGSTINVTLTWDSTGWAYGDYYLGVGTNASVQTFTSRNFLRVTLPGNIDGNDVVDIFDAIKLAGALNTSPGYPNWNPNSDLNGDGTVDIYDAIVLAGHYNKSIP